MDTSSIIAASSAVIVAALSYWFTKAREREADWRKWKFEQYKEFVSAISGIAIGNLTPEGERIFLDGCNTLNLIGSQRVLDALSALIESFNAHKPRAEQNILLSKLIWEIRNDVGIPGTPKAEEYSAHLWYPHTNNSNR